MNTEEKLDVVTIDGPAGAGKSTVARQVARRLDYTYLDTGAMYRAVALGAFRKGLPAKDDENLKNYLNILDVKLITEGDELRVLLNGRDVSEEIRKPHIGNLASEFSALASVREYCTVRQREMGEMGRIVAEGRDMGTVVFPDARWKFFLVADFRERAMRRWRELKEKGREVPLEKIQHQMATRDKQDSSRRLAPLKPAADAVIIDTTFMEIDDVVNAILSVIMTSH